MVKWSIITTGQLCLTKNDLVTGDQVDMWLVVSTNQTVRWAYIKCIWNLTIDPTGGQGQKSAQMHLPLF